MYIEELKEKRLKTLMLIKMHILPIGKNARHIRESMIKKHLMVRWRAKLNKSSSGS